MIPIDNMILRLLCHFVAHIQIKENMFAANKEHKETLQRMEQKFFEEKVRKD